MHNPSHHLFMFKGSFHPRDQSFFLCCKQSLMRNPVLQCGKSLNIVRFYEKQGHYSFVTCLCRMTGEKRKTPDLLHAATRMKAIPCRLAVTCKKKIYWCQKLTCASSSPTVLNGNSHMMKIKTPTVFKNTIVRKPLWLFLCANPLLIVTWEQKQVKCTWERHCCLWEQSAVTLAHHPESKDDMSDACEHLFVDGL